MDIFGLSGVARALIAAAIAVVPAIVVYVRGRRIIRFIDDPALPERLFAGRRLSVRVFVITIVALVVLTGSAAIWAVPFALIAHAAAGLGTRRTLFGETWGLAAYLSFRIRFFTAMWSFWLLVCAMPAIALSAGPRAWIAAAAMGIGMMLYAGHQSRVIRWLLRTRPIGDETTRGRFDRLAAACGIPAPRFEVVDMRGGGMANAFALPSLARSSVIFTAPLLARLDADEADGICAHELAHLEYYNARRMRQRRLITRSLVAAGAVLTPLMQFIGPSMGWMVCAVWPVVAVISVASLVRNRQKHETASDLRAVALTGNPEALIRALVKLHAMARVPRRWDANLERHLSHPSLKRRIQDIRAAAGTAPAALGDTAVFEGADGTARAVFGDDSLEWIEGTSASYRLRYDRLGELRVAATRTGETRLLAADRTGHRWQMPLRAADLQRLQAVLDIVDARVGTVATASPTVPPLVVRAATLTVLVLSLNTGMIAAAMVMALALARPAAPLLSAAGLAAISGALLAWRDPGSIYALMPDGIGATLAAILFAAGIALLWIAYARRRDDMPARVPQLVALIGVAALTSWILPLVASGRDAVGLYQAARDWPSSVVLPLAFAGALLWWPGRIRRVAAGVAAVASIAAACIGSQAFLERFGGDPFLVPVAEVSVRTLDRPIREFSLPFAVSSLEVSPSGRSVAAISRRPDARPQIQIGRAGEPLTAIDADGVLFVDDDRALIWTTSGSRTDLREIAVTAPAAADWHVEVDGLSTPAVSLDAASKRWRLASPGVSVVDAREGVIGSAEIASYSWAVPAGHASAFVPIAMTGNRAIAVEPRPDLMAPFTDSFVGLMFVLASPPRWRSTIWALGPDGALEVGTSRLELACQPLRSGGACEIFDASRTRFFTMDAGARGFTMAASLPGRFFTRGEPQQGAWLTGWYQSTLVAVRFAPADAIRIASPGGERPQMLAASDHAAAGVWYQMPEISSLPVGATGQPSASSLVRVYTIE